MAFVSWNSSTSRPEAEQQQLRVLEPEFVTAVQQLAKSIMPPRLQASS